MGRAWTPSTRRATKNEVGVLRGSDRFCRQAWIRFFSMNRHQRTVRDKKRGRGGARLLRRLLHEDGAGLVVDHVPPPVPSFKHVDRLERRRLLGCLSCT